MTSSPLDNDDLILQMLAADDERAVHLLFDRHYLLLFDLVVSYVHDGNTADDILQDLFVNLWVKRHKIRLRKPLARYIQRAAINRVRNYLRDQGRLKKNTADPFLPHRLHPVIPTPDHELHQEDIRKLWAYAKIRMSSRARMVFLLSRKLGMSNREIAVKLGISVKGVEKNMTSALKILREIFLPYLHLLLVCLFLM